MKTILVVEDDQIIRENILMILEGEGFNTLSATNGHEALEILCSDIPDLVISDILMPKMNGLELIQHFRQDPRLGTVPFIFLTAKAEKTDFRKGMNVGADDYIFKPFTMKELLGAVNLRLQKKEIVDNKFKSLKESLSLYIPHEFRNPLVTLKGYLDLIISDITSFNESEIVEMLKAAKLGADRLHNTIEKFILYNELVSLGDQSIINSDSSHVKSVKKLLENVIESDFVKAGREKDLEMRLDNSSVAVSESLLNFTVAQLIDNAIKFSKAGSTIEVTGEVIENDYRIVVIDYGRGMTQHEISAIGAFVQFDRKFYQQEGNGLGLVIIKKILDRNSGKIDIKSEKGKFTKVEVLLPTN